MIYRIGDILVSRTLPIRFALITGIDASDHDIALLKVKHAKDPYSYYNEAAHEVSSASQLNKDWAIATGLDAALEGMTMRQLRAWIDL